MTRLLSASILALLMTVTSTVAARALDADDLPSAVENAKTAADHEAIAAYYEGEAKDVRAKASKHRSMGANYNKHAAHGGGKGVRTPLNKSMPPHCEKLAADYDAAAKEYDAMAAAHREEASALK